MIFRTVKNAHYVCIHKGFLEDKNLSFRAKGLLAYCLGKPDNWEFHVSHLQNVSTEGRDAVYSAIKELMNAGYIMRTVSRVKGKFEKGRYEIYETPQKIEKKPVTENPDMVKPLTGNPDTVLPDPVNPPLVSNDNIISNERINIIAPSKADAKKPSSSLIKRKKHVQVSDEHHQKLIAKYGQAKTEQAYEFLNEWKESKSQSDPKSLTKHTDYYRITKWVMKELQEQNLTDHKSGKDPEEIEKFRHAAVKYIEKMRGSIKTKNLYVEDKIDHLRIGNDAIYYRDPKATELINHSLKKHDLIR